MRAPLLADDAVLPGAVAVLAAVVLLSGIVTVADAPASAPGPVTSAAAVAPPAAPPPGAAPTAAPTAVPVPTRVPQPQAGDAQALLDGLEAAVEQAATARFAGLVQRATEGETQDEVRVLGALDLPGDRGRAQFVLPALTAALEETGEESPVAEGTISWTAGSVSVAVDDRAETVERGSGDGGLLETLPDQPRALLRLAAGATAVNADAPVDLDGLPSTLVEAAVPADLAAELRLVSPTDADALGELPVEVWLDGAGLPLRVRLALLQSSDRDGDSTVTTTYDFRAWGTQLDLG